MTALLNDCEYLEKMMHEHREDCLAALSKVVHPKYLIEFAGIFSYALVEEDETAERLAEKLNLNQLHALAYLEREREFENTLCQQNAERF